MVEEKGEIGGNILPVNGDDNLIIDIAEVLVLEKRLVGIEAAASVANSSPSRLGSEHEILSAEHTPILEVMVSFYYSDDVFFDYLFSALSQN